MTSAERESPEEEDNLPEDSEQVDTSFSEEDEDDR